MKDFVENDELRNLFLKEGLHKPSEDFTENVVRYLEENKVISSPYKPLISKNAWWLIISGSISIILLVCWLFSSAEKSESVFSRDFLGKIRDVYSRIDITLTFNQPTLLIITLAMTSIGILLLFDLWFDSKTGRKMTE